MKQQDESNDSGGLLAFYGGMNSTEKRTFWGCFGGWTLDGLDFMIYPLVLSTIMTVWSVDKASAGFAATATLLCSAVGGWCAGYLSDRIGRVVTLQLTIAWFSFFTLLCAFCQTFDQLVICRTLLGFGFGGEWAAGAVLMGETIRARYRGRAVGTVQSGWAVGWGAAALIQAIAFSYLEPAIAWRAMFLIGAIPALMIFYLRKSVPEPEVSASVRESQRKGGIKPKMTDIFRPDVLKTTLLASLLTTGAQGGYYAINTWLPTYLATERQLSVVKSAGYLGVLVAGCFAGYLFGAWFSDRFGRRPLFLLFAASAIAIILIYTQINISNEVMLVLGFPLGFFASGHFSGMGPFLSEIFPTHIRGSGQGFVYNVGRGIGALFPGLVGVLSAHMGLANAMTVFAVFSYGIFFVAALILPETKGRELSTVGSESSQQLDGLGTAAKAIG
jgi:MFS family permease